MVLYPADDFLLFIFTVQFELLYSHYFLLCENLTLALSKLLPLRYFTLKFQFNLLHMCSLMVGSDLTDR